MNACKALSKRTGERCKNAPTPGRELCRFHGGKTPRGLNSPNYRHGRYSRAFNEANAARFAAIMDDPELLSTRDEIAALTLRLEALISRAEAETPTKGDKAWSQVVRLSEALATLRNVEMRRLEKLQGFMTLEQGQALARALAVSLRDRVASGLAGQPLIDAVHADLLSSLPATVGDWQGAPLTLA